MGARLAVAGLGIYVIAVWAVVGMTAYSWFAEPSQQTASKVETSTTFCLRECGVIQTTGR